jgi:hypothetical protein
MLKLSLLILIGIRLRLSNFRVISILGVYKLSRYLLGFIVILGSNIRNGRLLWSLLVLIILLRIILVLLRILLRGLLLKVLLLLLLLLLGYLLQIIIGLLHLLLLWILLIKRGCRVISWSILLKILMRRLRNLLLLLRIILLLLEILVRTLILLELRISRRILSTSCCYCWLLEVFILIVLGIISWNEILRGILLVIGSSEIIIILIGNFGFLRNSNILLLWIHLIIISVVLIFHLLILLLL